jgi:glucose-6-phosphate isomerase
MAHAWFELGQGIGNKAMVVLPYKDSLLLLGRYLQQLIMESLGKKFDIEGNIVHQGLTVYGNKGSTDQHAFVQQLRDGRHDFFANFVAVLESRRGSSIEVDEGHTSGDYLLGFLMGTRNALTEAGRSSLTVIIPRVDEWYVGALVALYERVVGFYAARIRINAYDQPGVEAGKKAAEEILVLQQQIMAGEEVPETDDTWLLKEYLALR